MLCGYIYRFPFDKEKKDMVGKNTDRKIDRKVDIMTTIGGVEGNKSHQCTWTKTERGNPRGSDGSPFHVVGAIWIVDSTDRTTPAGSEGGTIKLRHKMPIKDQATKEGGQVFFIFRCVHASL